MSHTRILIIDDNELIRYSLQLALEQRDFEVVNAADGEDARRLAEAYQPHLILLDVLMKGTSGLDVFADLRRCNTTKGIPIIFMTASENVAGIDVQSMDFVDLVLKPYELDFLCDRIKRLVDRKGNAST